MNLNNVLLAAVGSIAVAAAAGCGTSNICVAGLGSCKSVPLPQKYAIIDPSGSQAGQIGRQVKSVRAITTHGPMSLTLIVMGERPATSRVVGRVDLPSVDHSNPEAIATRASLLDALDRRVRAALARRTNASDTFGALNLAHDDAMQRKVKGSFDVFVLGDSEPAVPGLSWGRTVPAPEAAVSQAKSVYRHLDFSAERVTFVVGADAAAARKDPGYASRLADADIAVCKAAGASSCEPTTEIAEANT